MSRAGEEKEKGYDVIGFNLLHIWLFVTATTFSLGTEYTLKSKGDLNNDLLRFQFLITFNLKSEYRANIPVQECKCFTWVRSTDKIKRPQCFYVF